MKKKLVSCTSIKNLTSLFNKKVRFANILIYTLTPSYTLINTLILAG